MINNNKKAFTLAEVLVTLAIIGVVAALTIPTVVAKYQKVQYYTQFMKAYNTLSDALSLSIVNNGPVWTWSDAFNAAEESEVMGKYFVPYLKIAKICKSVNDAECFAASYKTIGGATVPTSSFFTSGKEAYLLTDGSSIFLNGTTVTFEVGVANIKSSGTSIQFFVDTNGPKGPNVIGRDLFGLGVFADVENLDVSLSKISGTFKSMGYQAENDNTNPDNIKYANCEPNEPNSTGQGCSDRLLKERKMNY